MNFIVGFIMGIIVATVGFGGIANMVDKNVHKVQEVIRENSK